MSDKKKKQPPSSSRNSQPEPDAFDFNALLQSPEIQDVLSLMSMGSEGRIERAREIFERRAAQLRALKAKRKMPQADELAIQLTAGEVYSRFLYQEGKFAQAKSVQETLVELIGPHPTAMRALLSLTVLEGNVAQANALIAKCREPIHQGSLDGAAALAEFLLKYQQTGESTETHGLARQLALDFPDTALSVLTGEFDDQLDPDDFDEDESDEAPLCPVNNPELNLACLLTPGALNQLRMAVFAAMDERISKMDTKPPNAKAIAAVKRLDQNFDVAWQAAVDMADTQGWSLMLTRFDENDEPEELDQSFDEPLSVRSLWDALRTGMESAKYRPREIVVRHGDPLESLSNLLAEVQVDLLVDRNSKFDVLTKLDVWEESFDESVPEALGVKLLKVLADHRQAVRKEYFASPHLVQIDAGASVYYFGPVSWEENLRYLTLLFGLNPNCEAITAEYICETAVDVQRLRAIGAVFDTPDAVPVVGLSTSENEPLNRSQVELLIAVIPLIVPFVRTNLANATAKSTIDIELNGVGTTATLTWFEAQKRTFEDVLAEFEAEGATCGHDHDHDGDHDHDHDHDDDDDFDDDEDDEDFDDDEFDDDDDEFEDDEDEDDEEDDDDEDDDDPRSKKKGGPGRK